MRCVRRLLGVLLVLAVAACTPGIRPEHDASAYFSEEGDLELAAAVAEGDREAVSDLVASGADPDARGTDDRTMLDWAMTARSLDGLVALLEAGADPDQIGYRGRAALHQAAELEDPAFLEALVDAGADVDVVNPHTGTTALVDACVQTRAASLEALVAAGADVDAADPNGATALHACGRLNQGAMILSLLEAGADPLAEDATGATFQDHYLGYDQGLLNDRAREERAAVVAWLTDHGVPVTTAE